MAKGLISIFALPHEIDGLHTTLYNLRRNAVFLTDDANFGLDITLCLSDELTDWSKTTLPKQYFIDKFEAIVDKLTSWAKLEDVTIRTDNTILGCVSQRRHSLRLVDDYDYTMWIDNDMFFSDKLLAYVNVSVDMLKKNNMSDYVITPQLTRQWDESWDVLVQERLMSRDLNDNLVADVFDMALSEFGSIGLRPIPTFKAAGGWCTVINNHLLKTTGIPESLGHYGLEDTYVLQCAEIMRALPNSPSKPQQFVLDDLVVGENHAQQTDSYLRSMISNIDRKDEFRQIATKNYQSEVQAFFTKIAMEYSTANG